jgi:predicted alpha/beta superfamily hydrolase
MTHPSLMRYPVAYVLDGDSLFPLLAANRLFEGLSALRQGRRLNMRAGRSSVAQVSHSSAKTRSPVGDFSPCTRYGSPVKYETISR